MVRGAWQSTVHRLANSRTRRRRLSTHVQMSLDGGGSQTHSRQCSGIQRQELWAGGRVGSIHGSQGATGVSASLSLSSLSLIACPCLPLGKSARRPGVSKSMETVYKSQSPRAHSTVERAETAGRVRVAVGAEGKARAKASNIDLCGAASHQNQHKKEGCLSKISIQRAFF